MPGQNFLQRLTQIVRDGASGRQPEALVVLHGWLPRQKWCHDHGLSLQRMDASLTRPQGTQHEHLQADQWEGVALNRPGWFHTSDLCARPTRLLRQRVHELKKGVGFGTPAVGSLRGSTSWLIAGSVVLRLRLPLPHQWHARDPGREVSVAHEEQRDEKMVLQTVEL